ncbi:MAG: hypothetical protein FJZ07_00410 [Candidatus Nealsonbacteria bacterium]|nr:hypothetical protein [Candidatus Nealsonbacteria bacterium]
MQNNQLIQPDSEQKNIVYLLLTEGVTKILSLLAFVFMARGLSQQSYGVIALAFSLGSLFFIFFNFGLDYHLIRDIRYFLKINNHVAFRELASTIATLKSWSLPVFLGIFTLIFLIMRWNWTYFPVMALIFLCFYIMSVIQLVLFFFRAFEKMKYEFFIRILQSALLLSAAFLFGYSYKNILLLAGAYLVVTVTILLGVLVFFIKKFKFIPRVSRWINGREIILVGKTKYLFFAGIATSIFSGVDLLIISKIRSIEEVAIYKNAVMITLALFMIPTTIIQGFYPKLIQHKVELTEFFRKVKKILTRIIPLGAFVALVLFVLGHYLILMFFGNNYIASVPLFRISLISFIFATINHVFGYGMIAIGKYKEYFIIVFIVSIVSVLLNIILVSIMGLMGGIITMNVSHFLLIILPLIYLYFLFMNDKRKKYLKTL